MSAENYPRYILNIPRKAGLGPLATALTAPLDPETYADEPTPLWVAAVAAHDVAIIARRVAASRPFAARVCGRCGATGSQPCVTASGKVMRRFHVARG